jgi:hypothetical protein
MFKRSPKSNKFINLNAIQFLEIKQMGNETTAIAHFSDRTLTLLGDDALWMIELLNQM